MMQHTKLEEAGTMNVFQNKRYFIPAPTSEKNP
jgi:hypothetical protein